MKVKNILAAIGLLMAAATGAWAADQTCNSGKIVKSPDSGMGAIGAGYLAPSGAFYAGSRYVGLQCDTAVGTTWTANTPRTFVISASSAYDPDGKYATALTAYALGKKVSFTAFTFDTASPDNAMCLSIGPAPAYTCNKTGRVLKAIAILPDSAM